MASETVVVRVSKEAHRIAKAKAAEKDMSLEAFLTKLILHVPDDQRWHPNSELIENELPPLT